MNSKKIVALIPMRHHSQRVRNKNFRDLAGKPLFHYIIDTLSACPEIDRIVVNTDSQPIQDDLAAHYPQVTVLVRPPELCADDIPMNDILLYDTEHVTADLYLQTHSTNPLLKTDTVSKAIHNFLDKQNEYDSLFSVTRLQTRLWDRLHPAHQSRPGGAAAKPRTCRRSTRRIPASTSSPPTTCARAATASGASRSCSRRRSRRPWTLTKKVIFSSPIC